MNSSFEAGNGSFKAHELSPGTVILNTYEVRETIGSGGMGAVYRVYHRYLQKEMAMKTLRADQMSQNTWLRFQAEAKAIAKLEHPNIVQIFDMGIAEDGQPFYTMELLKGQGLDRWIKRNPITAMQALFVFRQVALALAFAHERGIIHRDIKPANIVLTFAEANEPPVVKVVDFGIAKLVLEAQDLTKEGEVFGSPLYMSPEQASGLKVDKRSDIYSFGCALYETLTGFPPFKGKSAMETMLMHLERRAVPIERARTEVSYPPGLSLVVQKCMAKEPDERYGDASLLAQDLLKVEQGKGSEVSASGQEGRFSQEERRDSQCFFSDKTEPWSQDEAQAFEVDDFDSRSLSPPELRSGVARGTMDSKRKGLFFCSLLGCLLLIAGGLWGSYCSGVGILGWGKQSAAERERISCQKLYGEIDHFCLTPADLRKLDLREAPRANYKYYLFPADGEKSVGRIYETPGDGSVQYRAAAGLVVRPMSGPGIKLVLSPELAVHLKLFERFRAEDLVAVCFPLVALEGDSKAADCALSVNQAKSLLTELQRFKGLEYINCGTASLDNDCFLRLADFPALKALEVNESVLAPDVSLEKLSNLNELTGLNFPNHMGPFAILKHLNSSRKLENITVSKYDAPEEIPANRMPLRHFRLAIFQHCQLSAAAVGYLATCENIEEINFRHSFVPKGAMPILEKMKKLKRLTLPADIAATWGDREFEAFKQARKDITISLEGKGRERGPEFLQSIKATGFDPSK